MATQQDLMPLQHIHAENTSSVLSNKVMRAFACRVLSMKLGFTKDQISYLTDDEINDHMDREFPRLTKAELEAELKRIAELRVTDRRSHNGDLLFVFTKSFMLGILAVCFASPCLILVGGIVGGIVAEFFPAKYSASVHETGIFAGITFAFIGPLLVEITAKNQSFETKEVNIKQEQPQLSKECFTFSLSEYKYSTTSDLKGLKGLIL